MRKRHCLDVVTTSKAVKKPS